MDDEHERLRCCYRYTCASYSHQYAYQNADSFACSDQNTYAHSYSYAH
jgi:hypothetical protein